MRLTADVILRAQISINPLKDRELNLRGYKAPAIENLGVTKDGFDCIDLSDNEVKKLENFPRLRRLRMLLLNNNHISKIQEDRLADALENLECLVLTGNRVALLSEVDHLASLRKLDTLSLQGNPVAKRKFYREYVIHKLPHLRVLDYQKIKPRERDAAAVFFNSQAGKRIEADAGIDANGNGSLRTVTASASGSAVVAAAVAVAPPPPPPQAPTAVAPPPPAPLPVAVAVAASPVKKQPQAIAEEPAVADVDMEDASAAPSSPVKRKAVTVTADAESTPTRASKAKSATAPTRSTPSKTSKKKEEAQEDVEMNQVPYTPSKPIPQLTVSQLREALKELGLPTKGLKAELVKRLKDAVGGA